MEQWTRPGQVSWEQFTGYAQLFANIILAARRELREWNEKTFQEMMRWATFLEELTNDMEPGDELQAQRYLENPSSFANTGYDNRDVTAVVEAGLSVKILGAATHYLLRQVISNARLPANMLLFRAVMRHYIVVDDEEAPEDVERAIGVWVKDAAKEIASGLPCLLGADWMHRNASRIMYDKLQIPASPTSYYDCELRFFLNPSVVRQFAQSRALLPKLKNLSSVEHCVRLCRPHPDFLPVVLLAMVPRPLFMQDSRTSSDHCVPLVREMLVAELIRHQHVIGLWGAVDSFVILQIAAQSPEFASAMP